MVSSEKAVYEALGLYVDSLATSVYVGTTRGSVLVYAQGSTKPIIERFSALNIFYGGECIEIAGFGDNCSFFLRSAPESVDIDEFSGKVEMKFMFDSGDEVVVELQGAGGFSRSLKWAVDALEPGKKGKEKLLLHGVRY
ncbi:MAG: hypothetical protein PWQ79_1611 [Thermococcaceae archaeon]|nr:hypothetical protein [Thermococcaceae archaeon]MDK2914696.1 hypothetical protein [Thermococcaceae archaeon]